MISETISKIKYDLDYIYNKVDEQFILQNAVLNYRPANNGWSIGEILEHIYLTNHYLLILIRKGTKKALESTAKNNLDQLLTGYDLRWEDLKQIGEHASFEWSRPDHMEPTGKSDLSLTRTNIRDQVNEVADCLYQMRNGEGVLYQTMMSVNDLGKIDVYHYIYFLIEHARRHLTQIQKVKDELKEN